jgi:hypothetical protein
LVSLPEPDTNVCGDCACAGLATKSIKANAENKPVRNFIVRPYLQISLFSSESSDEVALPLFSAVLIDAKKNPPGCPGGSDATPRVNRSLPLSEICGVCD